jgi:hypothetical protein
MSSFYYSFLFISRDLAVALYYPREATTISPERSMGVHGAGAGR